MLLTNISQLARILFQWIGCVLQVIYECPQPQSKCPFMQNWTSSQLLPGRARLYDINVSLSAAIVSTGNQFGKVLRLLNALKTQCIGKDSFHKHVKSFVYPAIRSFYSESEVGISLRILDPWYFYFLSILPGWLYACMLRLDYMQ